LAVGEPLADPARAPILPALRPNMPRHAAVLAYNARERALLERVQGYTNDLDRALALVAGLRELHARLCAVDAERHEDEFLGMVSHELRTPIHILRGFGDILLRDLAGPLSEPQRGYVGKMMDVVRVLGRLVDDLIDLAQIGAGAFRLELAPADVAALVHETLGNLAPLAAQKELALVDDVPAHLPTVRADARRLGQVLTNLVGNAIKFTPPGGRVRVTAAPRGAMLRLEVHDTGPGIASGDLEPIFERFVRRGPATNGMGLGLAISRAIVAGHGGTIGVASTPGRGSVFHVELPLHGHPPS
jgi:signal transduction histidine kinase